MRKRTVILAGLLAASLVLGGCAASKGLETDAIKISNYKEVEVAEVAKPGEITDEDVESSIQATLEAQAEIKEVTDRPVESGDTVNIDFLGKINGEAFEGGSAEGYPLTIGSGTFIEGFEDSIIGHKIGEMSEDSTTVAEYKEEVKKDLEEQAQTNYDSTLQQNAWQAVLENTEVNEYPQEKVDEMADSLIRQYKDAAEYYGMEYEDFVEQQMGYSMEDFETEVDAVAKENVKDELAVEAIAKAEKIELTDEAYEEQVKTMAEEYGYEDADAMKEAFDEDTLKQAALKNLVMAFVKENCLQVAE